MLSTLSLLLSKKNEAFCYVVYDAQLFELVMVLQSCTVNIGLSFFYWVTHNIKVTTDTRATLNFAYLATHVCAY